MTTIDYERKDYANLAKEFGCIFRIGTYGVKFLSRGPTNSKGKSKIYKIVHLIPLTGWITDNKEVVRIMRERGLEL